MALRKFIAEGALHLHSSDPLVFSPGELRHVIQRDDVRDLVRGCNLYLITSRPRIFVKDARLDLGVLRGDLVVWRDSNWTSVPFELPMEVGEGASTEMEVWTAPQGTHVVLQPIGRPGGRLLIHTHTLVARSKVALTDEECDLQLLYVGQGIGRKKARTALERLRSHETLQAILADHHTFHPEREILILLYRFEHHRNLISTGGDLSLEPQAAADEERGHLGRICGASLSREERISLAEAALINHFKPYYNVTYKATEFSKAKRVKTLRAVLREDLTGLIVEINTSCVRGRLGTEHRPHGESSVIQFLRECVDARREEGVEEELLSGMLGELSVMSHAHFAMFPFTEQEERESFLHGIGWRDVDVPANPSHSL